MLFLTNSGEWAVVWVFIACILFLLNRKRGHEIVFNTLLAVIFSSFLNDLLLKTVFYRERPYLALQDVHHLGTSWHNSSFVSGHTASSFAAALVLSSFFPKFSALFIALALGIAYSRIYVGMHYPSDIIGGVIIGIISAYLVYKLRKK